MLVYLNVPLTASPSSNESEEETDTMIGSVNYSAAIQDDTHSAWVTWVKPYPPTPWR
jgi:hypothetical protein